MKKNLIAALCLTASLFTAPVFAGDADGSGTDAAARLAALEKRCDEQQATIQGLAERVEELESILQIDADAPHANVVEALQYDISNLKTAMYQLRTFIN